ncbi:MAG: hypothetical protein GPJ02_24970, partial [Microcystis aeruginosa G13-12]|nr:hypothetical protein [Microcystis aeruginosa G13-12]
MSTSKIVVFSDQSGELRVNVDILAAVKRTAIPHHATFLGWSLNGVDASRDAASLTEV